MTTLNLSLQILPAAAMLQALVNNHTNQHQFLTDFFVPKKEWSSDKKLVSAVVFLWASRQNKSLSPNSNARSLQFSCKAPECSFYLSFTLSAKLSPPSWRVAIYRAHTCPPSATEAEPLRTDQLSTILEYLEPHPSLRTRPGTEIAGLLRQYHLTPPSKDNDRNYFDGLSHRISKFVSRQSDPESPIPTALPLSLTSSEYAGLSDFKSRFEQIDSDNKLIITNTTDLIGRTVYQASFLVIGPVLRMARHPGCTHQYDADGSFFKNEPRKHRMSGRCKAIVLTDANGQIWPLIIVHDTQSESIESWQRTFKIFFELVPKAKTSISGIGSDRHGGLMAQLKAHASPYGYRRLDPSFELPLEQHAQEWEVEKILEFMPPNLYLIQWKDEEETTWEPRENLTNCQELLDAFPTPDSSSSESPSASVADINSHYPSSTDGEDLPDGPGWIVCLQHLKNNIRYMKRNRSRAHSELATKLVVAIAYSRTTAGATFRLQRLRETDPELFAWLRKLDPSLWIQVCWRPGRHVARTSNSVEAFWSSIEMFRYLSNISAFFMQVYSKTCDKIREFHCKASSFTGPITLFAQKHIDSKLAELSQLNLIVKVTNVENETDFSLSGIIKDSWGREFLANLSTRTCTCTLRRIHYLPCVHLLALANRNGMLHAPGLLVDSSYFAQNWQSILSTAFSGMMPLGFAPGDLEPNVSFNTPVSTATIQTPKKRSKRTSRGSSSAYCSNIYSVEETSMKFRSFRTTFAEALQKLCRSIINTQCFSQFCSSH